MAAKNDQPGQQAWLPQPDQEPRPGDPAWHARRRSGIGGSDAAVLLGASQYRSPKDLWAEKLGLSEPSPPTLSQQIGTALEPLIVAQAAEKLKVQVQTSQFRRHPKNTWCYGNLDALSVGQNFGIEAKFSAQSDEWGDPLSQDIVVPPNYYLQCLHYMAVMSFECWYLAALVFGPRPDFRLYRLELDKEMLADVLRAEHDFWFNNVLKKIAPEGEYKSDGYERYLRSRTKALAEVIDIQQRPELMELLKLLRLRHLESKMAEQAYDSEALRIKEQLLKLGVVGVKAADLGEVTWRQNQASTVTDWESVAREAGAKAALIAKHTKPKDGNWVLRPKWSD